jgi:putative ABC transport system substrate-binding protein
MRFDRLKRRDLLTLLGGTAVARALLRPVAARAQQGMPLVAVWMGGGAPDDPVSQARASALRDALRELGWIEGRNIRIVYNWSALNPDQIRTDAARLVGLYPDVIVTTGAPTLAALHRLTRTTPIVFVMVTDPVSDGFVASLANPGGNITGFTIFEHSFAGKWLEMLKEAAPAMTRVAVMQNPDHPAWTAYLHAINEVAPKLGVEVTPAPASNPAEIESALDAFARAPNGGLIILPSNLAVNHRALIAAAAIRHRLPSIYSLRFYPTSGGLMSYGVVLTEPYRQAAAYVDRILKGTKPAELPVQASAKFELVINLTTAKAIGVTIPQTLQVRADEVIE